MAKTPDGFVDHRKRAAIFKSWSIIWFVTSVGEFLVILACLLRSHG